MFHLVLALDREGQLCSVVSTSLEATWASIADRMNGRALADYLSAEHAASLQSAMQQAEATALPVPLTALLTIQTPERAAHLTGPLCWLGGDRWNWVAGDATPSPDSEAELLDLYNNAPCGFHSLDPEGRVVRMNDTELNWIGYTREEVLGRRFLDFLTPESKEIFHQNFPRLRELGGIQDLAFAFVCKDGRHLPMALTATVIRSHNGEFLFTRSSVVNISERLESQRALVARERRFHAFMDNHPAVAFMKDTQGRYVYANQTMSRQLGRPAEELLGTRLSDWIPSEMAQRLAANDRKVIETGKALSFEEETRFAGDLDRTWLTYRFPFHDESGDVFVGGITIDVTQRKRDEQALLEAKLFAESVADRATAQIYIFNFDTFSFDYLNRAAVEFLGSLEFLASQPPGYLFQTWHPEDAERMAAHLEEVRTSDPGELLEVEVRIRNLDGEFRWLWLSNRSFTVRPDGSTRTLLGMAHDVTDRKLLLDDLARARDAALESARLKSEFLATMSHEIRTPMNGVIGLTELLLTSPLSPEQQGWAEDISASADALLTVINDILDFSKIEAGKLTFEEVEFDPTAVLEEVVQLMTSRASTKGLELGAVIDADVPGLVRGDPGRLRQVLLNLVSNAVKFTERGQVTARLQLARSSPAEEGACLLRFSVQDTGIGITPELSRLLFQPFVQADGSHTRRFGGTGLGLAICKQLVTIMGGNIGVESEAGLGSTFHFTVRLMRHGAPSETYLQRHDLHGRRVMLVDGNNRSRRMLSQQVAAWGMQPTETGAVDDARRAVESARLEQQPFDYVIIDSHRLGDEAVRLARDLKGFSRVVMVSTYGGLRPEVDAHLLRPLRSSQLYDCLVSLTEAGCWSNPARAQRLDHLPVLPEGAPLLTGAPRILLAEDNAVNTKVALAHLRRLGHLALAVRDGQQALQAWKEGSYDLVLMDCQMPELDGFGATASIRAEEERQGRPRVPIVALTANAMRGDRERCVQAGMDDYISKPINLEQLKATLERWLPCSPPGGADD